MARTADQVMEELLAISPDGDALPLDGTGFWPVHLAPLADALAGAEQLYDTMLAEVDPRTAVKFLPDFERVLGPDPLGRDQVPLDLGQRQALAAQRWAFTGGCSPNFYIGLAALMGIEITITTFTSSQCGATACGDVLAPQADELTWMVLMPAELVFTPVCGAAECGDYLGQLLSNTLASVITLYAQPHTLVLFATPGQTAPLDAFYLDEDQLA